MHQGYYRFPTIAGDTIVFTGEDDLWSVPTTGGIPRRLTAGTAEASHAHLSPDGKWLAYTGRDEGHVEVYVMPAEGGEDRRLTFFGAVSLVAGWSPDGEWIYFASNAYQAFSRVQGLYAVPVRGGQPRALGWGPARHISHAPLPGKGVVLGRNTGDPARWKRYRGGTTGDLWIDVTGGGTFERLKVAVGNPTTPMWVGDRIYFLADHEGVGNLYSCRPDGGDLARHTDHDTFYARQASTDGQRIVYHAGADIYMYDPATGTTHPLPIDWHSPAPQMGRKFADAARYLDGIDLHPAGHSVALTTRGKPFTMGNWAGAVMQLGEPQGVRYRLPAWLHDGKRVAVIHDARGEECVTVFTADGSAAPEDLGAMDLGRVTELRQSPKGDHLAIVNHRSELLVVDVAAKQVKTLDVGREGRLTGAAWSPDGKWVAYSFPLTARTSCIKLANLESGETHQVTEPLLIDGDPSWDPKGDYLYFLSHRHFDPVYDNLHFDLGFPKGIRPALVTLRADVPSPFVPKVEEPKPKEPAKPEGEADKEKDKEPEDKPLVIELAGITRRLAVFPVPEARYVQLVAIEGKVMLTSHQPEGALNQDIVASGEPKAHLQAYDFATQKLESVIDHVSWLDVSLDRKSMLVAVGERYRVLPAGEKVAADAPKEPGKESGWLELGRVRVSIEPRAEWRQMYREAWRLQRDQFWTADMSSVDWQRVHELYLPLLERVSTRGEFSDLLWEMQGELGTSHAYEWGGDYRPVPRYDQGHLGAEFAWDEAAKGYRLTRKLDGDHGDYGKDSPLNRVGLGVEVGDVLIAVGGQPLGPEVAPNQALVHQAGVEVALTFAGRDGGPARTVQARTLTGEWAVRYRGWVEGNRRRVHEATNGRIGYVHIPDMGAIGYAEFHRGFLGESQRDGLVVDVRNNGGGHVSQLILEKLARRRLGYDVARWGATAPYPDHAIEGPMVAITNEVAGSDGDIFSHCFKLMKLGPLIGKRTWGGVIGIWPRHALVDGTYTTQPEFSFWFKDVGWGVENYGTDPDIEVDIAPHAYKAGEDTQLEKAISVVADLLAANPPVKPDFTLRPNLAPPKLPPRG
ncbi:MAG: peptidase [Cyanobacteria bacterium RYN_339]|nr:peptidase [Cyanobacteria bacterium RYN_339]